VTLAIRTERLSKTYRSGFLRIPFQGLQALDLEVPRGVAFGFVGPNGAGKTTAIKTLVGLQRPTGGNAWIHGVPIAEPRSRRSVGFLPERPYFYEHLTAREFMDFYARLSEVPASDRAPRIARLLERVGLERFRDVRLGKFSKGMLQRAGLAQALVADPELVILDEPMSGLDPLGRVLVRDVILEERRAGRTVFFSSHILSDVEAICDQVAIVVSGTLRGQGTVDQLLGQTVNEVHVRAELAGDAPVPPLRREGAELHYRVAPEHVDALVDQLRAAGAHLRAIEPVQKNLEQVLLDEVERAKPVTEKRLGVLA
jgi:ABC-2 type transport system ATP-binding protein